MTQGPNSNGLKAQHSSRRKGRNAPYRGDNRRQMSSRSTARDSPSQSTASALEQQADTSFSASAAQNASMGPSSGSHAPLTIDLPTDTPRFADLAQDNLIHPLLLQTLLEDMKFNHMTPVQAATLRPLLTDRSDVLAQAKTGTGKTVAFLLPAIQNMLSRRGAKPGQHISLLVISPTRELAMQIADEARSLLQRMPTYKVRIAIGGTNKDKEYKQILSGCDILVATPGRLYDHLGSDDGALTDKLQKLHTLVLDEADRLLDMGFLDSLKKIIACLPDKTTSQRQGMLFSATVPQHVQKVAHLALSKDYTPISTIPEGEVGTHERVPQQLIVVPTFSDMAAGLLGALRQELAQAGPDAFKAIVFAPTAGLVDFYAEILAQFPEMPKIVSLHSRMTQSKRSRTTEEYRKAKNGILIATDVIARGMDFPSVTNVFQAGLPFDKESYIHRLGRTGRAGAEGRGTFIVATQETWFPKFTLKEISFNESPANLSAQSEVLEMASRLGDLHAKVYQAWLGFYKSYTKPMGWSTARLVMEANNFALKGLGAPEIPTLPKSTVGKMGLKGVKGLNVGPDPPRQPRGGGQNWGR